MALLNRSLGHSYDTPPGGDFARYVDQLLARQSTAAQVMVATTAAGAPQRPAAARPTGAKPRSPGSPAAPASPAAAISTKADELLERIRQLEARRQAQTGSAQPGAAKSAPATVFAPASASAGQDDGPSGLKLLGFGIAAVLGIIFPPLGVVMLLGLMKKAFGNKDKQG